MSGRLQAYRLLPVALKTCAIDWEAVRAVGGVEVSSAAAWTLRFGRPIMGVCSGHTGFLEFAIGCDYEDMRKVQNNLNQRRQTTKIFFGSSTLSDQPKIPQA